MGPDPCPYGQRYVISYHAKDFLMKKDFHRINIPKLPVLTTEEGIKLIKNLFGKLKSFRSSNGNQS